MDKNNEYFKTLKNRVQEAEIVNFNYPICEKEKYADMKYATMKYSIYAEYKNTNINITSLCSPYQVTTRNKLGFITISIPKISSHIWIDITIGNGTTMYEVIQNFNEVYNEVYEELR